MKFKAVTEKEATSIIEDARELERQTKPKGRHNGDVTGNGLMILYSLLREYLDPESPYFDLNPPLEEATGLGQRSLMNGLKALEATGFLAKITS